MLANATSPTETPVDRSVREIVAVCAKHNLECGSVQNLVGFMHALNNDKHLAMDFWSVVARLSASPEVTSQPEQLLGTIVQAVTGSTVEEVKATGPSHKVLVRKLASMLAGDDVSVAPEETAAAPAPEHEPELSARRARMAMRMHEAVRATTPARTEHAPPRTEQASEEEIIPPAPIVPISSESWGERERSERTSTSRLVLDPEPKATKDVSVPAFGSLSTYSETPEHRSISAKAVAPVAAILVLVAAGYLALRTGILGRLDTSAHAGFQSAVAAWNGQTTASTVSPPHVAAVPPATAIAPPASAPPASPSASRPTGASIPAPAPAQPAKVYRPQHLEEPAPRTVTTASQFDSSAADVPVVHEAEMKQRLISSRIPVYPDAARAKGIAGRVVMEAVINKAGAVTHLHVIDGDPALRRAALEAVSSWRYRPYLVNGQPSDVATTISVVVGPNEWP